VTSRTSTRTAPDTYIARRSHRTLSVLLETSRLDTRLTTTISWQGTSATCEMGGGTLAFDAPIERRGGAREPPDTFVTRRAGDVLRAWVRGLGTGADESPVPFEAVFDIVDRGPGRYGDAAGALAPVTEVQSIVGGELLLNDPSCPGPPTSVVAEGEITRADTRLEGRGWRLRGLWNGDEDAERCRAAEVQFSFAAPIE
jgi:hypothetical protein